MIEPMIIFIPMFVLLFVAVPAFITWMAADMLGVRGFFGKLVLFTVIAFGNWQAWQKAPAPVAPAVAMTGH